MVAAESGNNGTLKNETAQRREDVPSVGNVGKERAGSGRINTQTRNRGAPSGLPGSQYEVASKLGLGVGFSPRAPPPSPAKAAWQATHLQSSAGVYSALEVVRWINMFYACSARHSNSHALAIPHILSIWQALVLVGVYNCIHPQIISE